MADRDESTDDLMAVWGREAKTARVSEVGGTSNGGEVSGGKMINNSLSSRWRISIILWCKQVADVR